MYNNKKFILRSIELLEVTFYPIVMLVSFLTMIGVFLLDVNFTQLVIENVYIFMITIIGILLFNDILQYFTYNLSRKWNIKLKYLREQKPVLFISSLIDITKLFKIKK